MGTYIWKFDVKYGDHYSEFSDLENSTLDRLEETEPDILKTYTSEGPDYIIYAYYDASVEEIKQKLKKVGLEKLADMLTKKDEEPIGDTEIWLAVG